MGGLLAALATLAQPILARVLLALGFSVVTFTGLAGIITMAKDSLVGALGGGSMAALQLAGLAGVWHGLGWIFGAMTFSVSYWAMSKAVKIATG